jgi:hypothetical protein
MDELETTSMLVEGDKHCPAEDIPDRSDLICAYLWYDGYLATQKPTEFVPISEPFYTMGRPERESVPRGTCYCISTGGIPILCDALFEFLKRLGAEGETGVLTYRGFSKKAYDTIQQGFRRFLPAPIYPAEGSLKLSAELPVPLPPVFGLRSTFQVKLPVPGTATECHIGLSLDSVYRLKESMRRVLVVPLYRVAKAA